MTSASGARPRGWTEVWGDLLASEAVIDPYTFFATIRQQHGPVVWSQRHRAWIVTGHAEVAHAFKDERLSSDRLTPFERRLDPTTRSTLAQTLEVLRGWMLFQDAPDHTRLRDPLRPAFTPRSVERLLPGIRRLVDECIDELLDAGTCDLKATFAFPLPAVVIALLLGVPPADRRRFRAWSHKLAAVVFGAVDDPHQYELAAEGSAEFADYFTWLIREREREPGDDLVSALVACRDADDGLTSEELVGTCTMLLFAGHETTTDLITNAAVALTLHPDQAHELRRDPSLWAGAVEEFLRFDSPTKVAVRTVAVSHERGGQQLQAGEIVFLALADANRDPAEFPHPDHVDVRRNPRSHLAFGFGPHYCLGATLARVEARVALAALVDRCGDLQLEAELRWEPLIITRSLKALPVSVRARPSVAR